MGPCKVLISLFSALGIFGINVKQVIKQCHDLKYKIPFYVLQHPTSCLSSLYVCGGSERLELLPKHFS